MGVESNFEIVYGWERTQLVKRAGLYPVRWECKSLRSYQFQRAITPMAERADLGSVGYGFDSLIAYQFLIGTVAKLAYVGALEAPPK